MLKAMNRHYNSDVIKHIYDKVRSFDKPWALRTTVICGYPGETPADFRHMLDFLKQRPFELLGAFRYSPEEGTVGASLPHQTRASTKQVRFDSVMLQQSSITNELNSKYVGLTLPVLIEGYSEENSSYVGRCEFQAPEVDGCVYVIPARCRRPSVTTFTQVCRQRIKQNKNSQTPSPKGEEDSL